MASIKLIHYKSKVLSDGTSPILLRVIINRVVRNYPVGDTLKCKYYPDVNGKADPRYQWNPESCRFLGNFPNHKTANRNLLKKQAEAEDIVLKLEDQQIHYTQEDFKKRFSNEQRPVYVLDYTMLLAARLRANSKVGNALVYEGLHNVLKDFLKEDKLITEITPKVLNLFIESLQQRNLKKNTIGHYLRTLRAVCKRAMKEEDIEFYPFDGFDRWSEFSETTEKRALSKEDMLKIINYQAPEGSAAYEAMKMFTFMYVTYGLNFADLAKLTNKNVKVIDGVTFIRYYRSKGGKLYEIPLDETGLEILNYFRKTNIESGYIFPVLDKEIHITPEQVKTRIKTALKKVNSIIRDIASDIGIDHRVTSYVARHTFATVLYKEGENVGMISEMLGHSNLQTTLTYLKSFDHSEKLKAGKKLLE